MPAVATISRRRNPLRSWAVHSRTRAGGQGKPGTLPEQYTDVSRKKLLVSDYRHNLCTGSGSIAGATSRSRTTAGGAFGPLGVTSIRTFTDPQNPARVAVLMDVAGLDTVAASR
jgi:hypothetical protein